MSWSESDLDRDGQKKVTRGSPAVLGYSDDTPPDSRAGVGPGTKVEDQDWPSLALTATCAAQAVTTVELCIDACMHPGYRSHCPVLPPTIDWSAPYRTALELCP